MEPLTLGRWRALRSRLCLRRPILRCQSREWRPQSGRNERLPRGMAVAVAADAVRLAAALWDRSLSRACGPLRSRLCLRRPIIRCQSREWRPQSGRNERFHRGMAAALDGVCKAAAASNRSLSGAGAPFVRGSVRAGESSAVRAANGGRKAAGMSGCRGACPQCLTGFARRRRHRTAHSRRPSACFVRAAGNRSLSGAGAPFVRGSVCAFGLLRSRLCLRRPIIRCQSREWRPRSGRNERLHRGMAAAVDGVCEAAAPSNRSLSGAGASFVRGSVCARGGTVAPAAMQLRDLTRPYSLSGWTGAFRPAKMDSSI
jgi:hypothetical protein